MKFTIKIVVLMFMIFLSTPTLIGVLSDDIDTSVIYNMCEDENYKEVKSEVKALISDVTFLIFFKKETFIFYDYLLIHDMISKDIISPPPDRV